MNATNTGGQVVMMVDNQEAIRFLQERFAPALHAAGATGPPPKPEFWPVHRHLAARPEGQL